MWLREENDDTWETTIGRKNQYHNYREENNPNKGNEIIQESESRGLFITEPRNHSNSKSPAGFNIISNSLYGPDEDENIGLKHDEHKRRRGDPIPIGEMDINMGPNENMNQVIVQQIEPAISNVDLTDSFKKIPAKSAMQASRLK